MFKWKRITLESVIHCILWVGGIVLGHALFSHSDARLAYGYLIGWWAALYVGYVFEFDIRAGFLSFALYFLLGIIAVLRDWDWFYVDLPSRLSIAYLMINAMAAAIYSSQFIVNYSMRSIKRKYFLHR